MASRLKMIAFLLALCFISIAQAQNLSFYTTLCGSFAGYSKVHVDFATSKVYFYNNCPATSGISFNLNLLCGQTYWFAYGGKNWVITWKDGAWLYQFSTDYKVAGLGELTHWYVPSGGVYFWVDWPFCNGVGQVGDELNTFSTSTKNSYSPGSNFVKYRTRKICDQRVYITDLYNAVYDTTTFGVSNPPLFIYYQPTGTVQKFNFYIGACGWTGFCQ